ncbi:MAG: ABC transporter ATP-binding protein [Desulfotomaculales bacterium]
MNRMLEIKNLCKHYPGFSLQNVSFTLESGYIMGFIGPNGAGKTTTIKLIMGLIKKDAGEIRAFGLDNARDGTRIRDRIGFVYDEELTVGETRRLVAPFYSRWDDGAFRGYLERFELPWRKKVRELSRGMKMKLALAVALAHHADLIIMDEPTAGLDPVFRSELLEILLEFIQDERKGVFFSTHITADLDRVADYVTFLNRGEIVFSETREAILERYALVRGGGKPPEGELKAEFTGLRENRFGWEGLTGNVQRVRQRLGNAAVFERPTLEEIMLFTVRGNGRA